MRVYPHFLNDVAGRRCVGVGGGDEGEGKSVELLDCGAQGVLVGGDASEGLVKAAGDGRITWIRRNYQAGDLKDAFLAIVSETNPSATAPIYEEAEREKVLINAMDDVPHCTFVAGSVVRR